MFHPIRAWKKKTAVTQRVKRNELRYLQKCPPVVSRQKVEGIKASWVRQLQDALGNNYFVHPFSQHGGGSVPGRKEGYSAISGPFILVIFPTKADAFPFLQPPAHPFCYEVIQL
jgi:hypothetical protein